ncbi:MAG TPA: hypothetical protein PLN56_07075 [Methanoregulaceae archaeon]|nr:hypothetical protein [Methanoregulaceae archaeon]HPD10743.1 hypothetical protein [Methanoregulaceae archaeon]HRU77636.1 hypothetical protein [Rectinema sp.]
MEQEGYADNATPDSLWGSISNEPALATEPAVPMDSAPTPETMVETEAALFFPSYDAAAEFPLSAETPAFAEPTALSKETMIEAAIAYYINVERVNMGLRPYTYNETLASVARNHTLLMISSDYGGHTIPGEPNLGTRLTAAGIPWLAWGECISFGYPDLDADTVANMIVHDLVWDDAASSWGHRRIILDGLTSDPGYPTPTVYGFNLVGTGAAYGSLRFLGGARYTGWHATMDFVKVTLPQQVYPKIGIFRDGLWVLDYNGNYLWDGPGIDRVAFIGQAGDVPVIGDWNGDGTDKIGIFRDGLWVLDYNGNFVWDGPGIDRVAFIGQAGDVPVIGDWNGDGTDKIGIFRDGLWVLDYNGNFVWDGPGIDRVAWIGQAGDVPVIGDWNGDGTDKIGIFRDGLWVLDYNGNFVWDGPGIDQVACIGQAGDIAVVGDWNSDGTDKIGIFRDGLWVLDYSGNFVWDGPGIDRVAFIGQAGDIAVVGDWNSDGTDKIGIFRDGLWVLDYSGNFVWDGPGIDRVAFIGQAGDIAVVGPW